METCTIKTGFVTSRSDGTAWCIHRSLHDARMFLVTTKGHMLLEIRIDGWPTMREHYENGNKIATSYAERVG